MYVFTENEFQVIILLIYNCSKLKSSQMIYEKDLNI